MSQTLQNQRRAAGENLIGPIMLTSVSAEASLDYQAPIKTVAF